MASPSPAPAAGFSPYQKFVVGLLALLQFAVILDFMLMAPLGALIMPALAITPKQFGLVVSAYAFSAGVSGFVTAGFADRFDRKKLLLFFYAGFLLGTLWCGLAPTFELLLAARVFTGLFGGVIGSIVLAIATDLFDISLRGRVMGLIQTAFAASQVLGLPMGLFLSNRWNWHAPFIALAALGLAGLGVIATKLKPVDAHLGKPQEHSPFMHLWHTLTEPRHLMAFLTVTLLATGGFMLMPFSSAFLVHNLGIALEHLPTIYFFTGICTIVFGPLIGKAADKVGKMKVFLFGSALSIATVVLYTHLGITPLWAVVAVNVVMFVGIFSRMIPFQAMVTQVPEPTRRGAFNAISASIQQVSGGVASVVAGHIVTSGADGRIEHFPEVGYVVVGTTLTAIWLVSRISRQLQARAAA
ncbi:MAG TPA: MFS transporter [Burkholderiaceae bacterium]|jgi:predicted MFS family arabinose efflux permease|nr:MFS transporter [Burkholderiaceae bacterium]